MATSNLLDLDAELGSEEEDEDFDENGDEEQRNKQKKRNGGFDDSSEEEDDDDDEAAAEEVRKGFIVDEDDDEEDEEGRAERRRERRKRRREEREEEGLDEEDLDLIGELDTGKTTQSKFKRLKQGHRERERGVDEIFDDDDEDERYAGRGAGDELDDFIEEDELDDDERRRELEEIEVSRKPHKGLAALGDLEAQGLDAAAWEDINRAFGNGEDYDWCLEIQQSTDETGDNIEGEAAVTLGDVFEPSQLAERMLTQEDRIVRETDLPERYQVWRKNLPDHLADATDQHAELRKEAEWMDVFIWSRKGNSLDPSMREPLKTAVAKVLEFACIENFEAPFIFAHRKDYLIHREKITGPDGDTYTQGVKLLNQNDLWAIIEYDLKYRTLVEKRKTLLTAYNGIKEMARIEDKVIEDSIDKTATNDDVQDLQDYFNFRYSAELADWKSMKSDGKGDLKRGRGKNAVFEAVRAGPCYNVVRGFGINIDEYVRSIEDDNLATIIDDPTDRPEDLAAKNVDDSKLKTADSVLKMAKVMFTEELVLHPRLRSLMRKTYFLQGYIDCIRTEKGLRKLDEEHPYYDLKYLRHQPVQSFQARPALLLKMLKAQSEGYIELKLRMERPEAFRKRMYRKLESDNFSEVADSWNALRRQVLDNALAKLHVIFTRSVIEALRADCETRVAEQCRDEFSHRLDQAPYRPNAIAPGQTSRVLTLTNGRGSPNKDDVYWVFLDDEGRLLEQGTLKDLRLGDDSKALPDGEGVKKLANIVGRRKPDVIGVSGFSPETRLLYKDLQEVARRYEFTGPEDEQDHRREPLEIVMVNDEVARLYYQSERAAKEHPTLAPLNRYAVAIGRYLQSPIKEYATLGKDISSISFHPDQNLVSPDKLLRSLETAMIDIVNLIGVDIHDALDSPYTGRLMQYVCGLGPRKAQGMLDTINRYHGGQIILRDDLIASDEESGTPAPLTVNVWQNCASFICFVFDSTETTANYLDGTRIHPEDYDLASKIASDALELDEEDIRAEEEEYGKYAIVRKLDRDGAADRVNDLELEEYAMQLQERFNTRKRATLETIRNELISAYEELRHDFHSRMPPEQVFTMLTGETEHTLHEKMVVPVALRKIFQDHIEGRLDCGIDVGINAENFRAGIGVDGMNPRDAYHPGQVVQGKLIFINRASLTVQVSLKESDIHMRFRDQMERQPGEWDFDQEDDDARALRKQAETLSGRTQRQVKHPLFRNANSKEAEQILAGQSPGDCVIRPSSNGNDHLAITWKVADHVFQHVDVLELDKDNEFSVGRTLKIGSRYTYSDLDELIEVHVKAMARKVDEIMNDERYQSGTQTQTGTYSRALFAKTITNGSGRGMACVLHASKPHPEHVRFLYQSPISRILHPLLQGWTRCEAPSMAYQGHSKRIRADEESVPRHEGLEERLQDNLHASVIEPRTRACRRSRTRNRHGCGNERARIACASLADRRSVDCLEQRGGSHSWAPGFSTIRAIGRTVIPGD